MYILGKILTLCRYFLVLYFAFRACLLQCTDAPSYPLLLNGRNDCTVISPISLFVCCCFFHVHKSDQGQCRVFPWLSPPQR